MVTAEKQTVSQDTPWSVGTYVCSAHATGILLLVLFGLEQKIVKISGKS